jgi:ArsR family transcriptional regulator
MNMNCNQDDAVLKQFRKCTPVFTALGDPNRQDIIMRLAENGRLNVNQITEKLTLSRPAISHHLKILREAGILSMDRVGKEKYYYLSLQNISTELKGLFAQIEENCMSE